MADDLGDTPGAGNSPALDEGELQKRSNSSVPPVLAMAPRWPIVAVVVATTILAVMAVVLLFVL